MNLAKDEGNLNVVAAFLRRWPLLPVVAIWFVVFWPMNTGQTVVGFRDSAYLYYPYFQWIDDVWASGEIPLWNPYCDLGYPVIADGSSSVFYPGKLVFFLRFLDYPVRYGWYLSLHVLLAVFGGYFLARRLGADRLGATLAGFAYGFGGSVLFQVCNVIYLVSAAWLPFGLASIWSMSKSDQVKHSIAAGTIAALMILGGDPQMAYLLGVIAVATFAWTLLCRRLRMRQRGLLIAAMKQRFLRLAIFAIVAVLLASVQIAPTYFWAKKSKRVASQLDVTGLSLASQDGQVLNSVYQFSQPPWTLSELVWPNVSGKPYPVHRRWIDILPGAERFWTPSLYVGLLTLLYAIGGFRIWGRSRKRVWLTAMAALFAIGSFGWFGAMWLVRELAFQFDLSLPPETQELGAYVGGVYWMATICLPKFVMFRYPAKLFVVASLAICVLAGLQFDSRRWRNVKFIAVPIAIVSIVGWLLVFVYWPNAIPRQTNIAQILNWAALFGPLDWQGSKSVVAFAMLQSTIVAGTVCSVALVRKSFGKSNWQRELFLCILMLDVLLANHWMLSQVDANIFRSESAAVAKLKHVQWKGDQVPTIIRGRDFPVHFGRNRSDDRLAEMVAWQRANLHPKHHLALPIAVRGSFTSIEPNRFGYDSGDIGWGVEPPSALRSSRFYFFAPGSKLGQSEGGSSQIQRSGVADVNLECNRLRIKVKNGAAVKLAFRVTTSAGWHVEMKDLSDPNAVPNRPTIERSDRFVAFELPQGEFEVTYTYNPIEVSVGIWISVSSWSLLLLASLVRATRVRRLPRRKRQVEPTRNAN